MVESHSFILKPGQWVGEGSISFSVSPQQLYFVTKWQVDLSQDNRILCAQEVQLEGNEELQKNRFHLFDVTNSSFNIILENPVIGQVSGTGIIDPKTIAWEFRGQLAFQGYEVYEIEGDELYKFHAEYLASDQMRTVIDGHIRRVY